MDAFADKFGEGPELDLLHVMGLFDRPASGDCIAALREPPAIPGLTDHLMRENGDKLEAWWWHQAGRGAPPPSEVIWEKLLAHLRDLGLLAEASHHSPDELDAHPLVREHFGTRLRAEREDAWKAAYKRLYEHLIEVPERRHPDTLAEMAPLFQAVRHSCQAGQYRASFFMYYDRISRQEEARLIRYLGAQSTDLVLLLSLLAHVREGLLPDFHKVELAWIFNQVGIDCRDLGHFRDALEFFKESLDIRIHENNWDHATRSAINLAELYLAIGRIDDAVNIGNSAVDYSSRCDPNTQFQVIPRINLAVSLHAWGTVDDTYVLFGYAEKEQLAQDSSLPWLYSYRGYAYCDLLLSRGELDEVQRRSEYLLSVSEEMNASLLGKFLACLLIARVAFLRGSRSNLIKLFDDAVDGLRQAADLEFIMHGLLVRAAFLRTIGEVAKSRRDLDEVMRITTRSGMRLFECDAHLNYARLILAEGGNRADARVSLDKAEALVCETGYHRRDREVAELEEKLGL